MHTEHESVDWEDPGKELWNRMATDMFELYKDDSNYGISLEDSNYDCPVNEPTSWAGFSYQRREKRDKYDMYGYDRWIYEVYYIFMKE